MTRRLASEALVGALCGAAAQKGEKAVSGIELTLAPRRKDVICGETLVLSATAANRAGQPAAVQNRPFSPVIYELRSPARGGMTYTTSQQAYTEALLTGRETPPFPPPAMETLAPGQSLSLRDDPALYLMRAIVPGTYRLLGRIPVNGGEARSAEVEIVVSPPQMGSLATLYCPYANAMVSVFDHTGPDQSVWLFLRETKGRQLEDGVSTRLLRLKSGKVDGVAVAIHAAPRLDGRWTAWLQNGSLGAMPGGSEPVRVDVASPRFVSPGFQCTGDSALFAVAGESKGRGCVQFFRSTEEALTKSPPAPLWNTAPERVVAHREDASPNHIHLVWADGGAIYTRAYSGEGKGLAAGARKIYTHAGPLRALELEPIGVNPVAQAYVLSGPVEPDGHMEYAAVPLAGAPARPQVWRVPPPLEPIEEWAISGVQIEELRVLARSRNRIWTITAKPVGQWQPLTGDLGAAGRLHLAAAPEGYWGALWTEPPLGLRYMSDPRYGANR